MTRGGLGNPLRHSIDEAVFTALARLATWTCGHDAGGDGLTCVAAPIPVPVAGPRCDGHAHRGPLGSRRSGAGERTTLNLADPQSLLARSGDPVGLTSTGIGASTHASHSGSDLPVPASRRGSVTFSYSCRDTREFRETYASWLMLQAYRLQQGDPSATYQQMKAALGEARKGTQTIERKLTQVEQLPAPDATPLLGGPVIDAGDAQEFVLKSA